MDDNSALPPDSLQPPPTALPSRGGNIFLGCLGALGIQAAAFVISLLLLGLFSNIASNRWSLALFCSWGFTQWLALIPIIRNVKAQGKQKTVTGLLIGGFLGVLLSSACASMLGGLSNMH